MVRIFFTCRISGVIQVVRLVDLIKQHHRVLCVTEPAIFQCNYLHVDGIIVIFNGIINVSTEVPTFDCISNIGVEV